MQDVLTSDLVGADDGMRPKQPVARSGPMASSPNVAAIAVSSRTATGTGVGYVPPLVATEAERGFSSSPPYRQFQRSTIRTSMSSSCRRSTTTENRSASSSSRVSQKLGVDPVAWTKTYVCNATARMWLMDFPSSEEHGGGPPRLRQLANDGSPRTDGGEDPFI